MFHVESPADPLEKSTEVVEDPGLSDRIIAQVKSRATRPSFAPSRPIDLFLLERPPHPEDTKNLRTPCDFASSRQNEGCELVRSLDFGPATTHDPTSMYRHSFPKNIRADVPIGDPVVGAHRLVRQEVPSFVAGSPATVIGAVGLSDDHDVSFAYV